MMRSVDVEEDEEYKQPDLLACRRRRWISTIAYVCIDDGGGPARSSSIRTRTTVAEVTGWRFTFPSWDPPNLSIHWEANRKRITDVSPTSTNCNTTTVRLKSNPTTPTPALPVLLQTETSRNEDNILRYNC